MARVDGLKNRKSFVKNDPRINRNGRPKKLPALDIIIAEVLGQETAGISAAQQILNALRVKAKKGDIRAAEALLNRGYGLPKQQVQLGGDSENPLTLTIPEKTLTELINQINSLGKD